VPLRSPRPLFACLSALRCKHTGMCALFQRIGCNLPEASGICPRRGFELRYRSFRIRNFKGVKDTAVELQGVAGANVFAFVGLNKSGKTTLLEAIHSFSPDKATNELLGGEIGVPFKDRVPRHLISEFTGDVSVAATLSVTPDDKKAISKRLLENHKLSIDVVTCR
jgi:hypothetical protein